GRGLYIFRVAFSPDAKHIVAASLDKTARVWDAESGQELRPMVGHNESINRATFSPDGRRIVTTSADKTARVWDADSGAQLRRLVHDAPVTAAMLARDGHHLLTATADNVMHLWQLPTLRELVDRSKEIVPRCLTKRQRETLGLSAEPPRWCVEMGKWPYTQLDFAHFFAVKNVRASRRYPPLQ